MVCALMFAADDEFNLIPQEIKNESLPDLGSPSLGSILKDHIEGSVRTVLISTPDPAVLAHCGYCDQLKENLKDGIPGVVILFQETKNGPWPQIELVDAPKHPEDGRRLWWSGALTKRQVESILREYPPQTDKKAGVRIGQIKGKSAFDATLKMFVADSNGEGIIVSLGSSQMLIPKDTTAKLSIVNSKLIVTFVGTAKPTVSYLGLKVSVESIEADQSASLLTVRLGGFPDVTVEVVD